MALLDDFVVVVQGPEGAGKVSCRGVADAPVVIRARVQVVADPRLSEEARMLTDAVWSVVASLGNDSGPCLDVLSTERGVSEARLVHNLLVVVCGPPPHDPELQQAAQDSLSRGSTVVPILAASEDPQMCLPPALRSTVALPYQASMTETTDEIVDLLLLAGEERRAFISYAQGDASDIAFAVFDALARRRFDVYLDRFRTPPSADFVERIDDELRDKAMVVVIESAEAATSTWVLHEIMTARRRSYGLLAVNVGGATKHPLIPAARRIELGAFDESPVCTEVARHHRAAILDQRHRRAAALEVGLRHGAAQASAPLDVVPAGQRCDLVGDSIGYSVLGSFRPAGVREARRIFEMAATDGRRPVVYCPRPMRSAGRKDQGWLDDESPVAVVPDGRLLAAARDMARGGL